MCPSDRLLPRLLAEVEELHPVHSAGIVRLPELVGVPFSGRVRALVDHPHFQRLRKVRQLSLTYLVYPGAVHTRFEHSLGVFETATRYLAALLTDRRAAQALEAVTKSDVESLLVAALLHDIGHYPFAHLLEDLYGEVADHVDLVWHFLTGEIGRMYPSLALPAGVPALGKLIVHDWPGVDFHDVSYFVSGATGGKTYADAEQPIKSLLRSTLDGSVDADKMDYLYRDSIHCGVPYGRFIDRDRFFQALTVAPDRPGEIALHEKGRIGMELFAYARSAMYSEVYWHHASRSITAMLNRAIREAAAGEKPLSREALMDLVFARTDEQVVEWLAAADNAPCRELMQLLSERKLYKRLLVVQRPVTRTLFEMLDRLKWEAGASFDRLQDRFVARINASGVLKPYRAEPLRPHDVLIDVPHRRGALHDVPIIREHGEHSGEMEEPSGVWTGIGEDFERWVRKIRIFCHPAVRADLEAKGCKEPPPALRDRLVNLLLECAWEEQPLQGEGARKD
ncbi:MAG: HD domain-containing protein [Myxococcales bacterium]|nr:MAG: HD domain-containing protein [Myxococcales bacterium]